MMVIMWGHSMEETFRKLDKDELCPDAYDLLMSHTKEIEKLVAQRRQNLAKLRSAFVVSN